MTLADLFAGNESWRADITKVALGYSIHLTSGVFELSGPDPWALTLRGARRRARRLVARQNTSARVIETVR